jgi:hypothetical protein
MIVALIEQSPIRIGPEEQPSFPTIAAGAAADAVDELGLSCTALVLRAVFSGAVSLRRCPTPTPRENFADQILERVRPPRKPMLKCCLALDVAFRDRFKKNLPDDWEGGPRHLIRLLIEYGLQLDQIEAWRSGRTLTLA